ncbi:hypothetical protein E2C01_031457 [Portunus trituberculatus]|uniref:Uncharacterized protein n=1 Tax=Portunus trituberculatus TaxID=210409 RepID=A0A5B7ESU6_PORTR|nr:hypothetical protein [Portunus trituberculatus]
MVFPCGGIRSRSSKSNSSGSMGAEGSKKVVREQKEYFSPEERQSVLAVAQKLAGSNGNITLPTLEKHIAKWYSPEIASRFIKVFLRGKTPTPTSLTCQMLVDTLGPLTKGTLEQHLYLTLTLAGGDQAGVDSDSIIKVLDLYLEVILGAYLKMVLGGAGCRGWSCGSGHKSIGHVCRAVLHDLLHAGASFKEEGTSQEQQNCKKKINAVLLSRNNH